MRNVHKGSLKGGSAFKWSEICACVFVCAYVRGVCGTRTNVYLCYIRVYVNTTTTATTARSALNLLPLQTASRRMTKTRVEINEKKYIYASEYKGYNY